MNYDVIIATKDRLNDLLNFIGSLTAQTVLPNKLIIVDATLNENGLKEECIKRLAVTDIELIYIKSMPGLTHQRNIGYKCTTINTEVVFFFDDDIELIEKDYIEKILSRFSFDKNKEIASVFGKIITPVSKDDNDFSEIYLFVVNKLLAILQRIFLLQSPKIYHVLPSGMSISNNSKTKGECYTDWQPGCCMSFRKEVLDKYQFDESLVGYSMREDLDMSYRVSRDYKILYLPSAQILHLGSPIQRLNAFNFGVVDIESWHWFVNKNMPYFINKIYFYWGLAGYLFTLLVSAILFTDKIYFYRFKGGLKALSRIFRINRLVTR